MNASLQTLLFAAALAAVSVLTGERASAAPPPPAPPWEAPLARQAPLAGRIHETAGGKRLTSAQLIERLAAADFVLLGERHDNPDHHRLQAWTVEAMLESGRRFTVALEMIDGDQAPRLAEFLASAPQDSAGIGAALGWETSGWPEWTQYQPIVAPALARGLPVLAANLPSTLVRGIARDGLKALPDSLATQLQLDPAADKAVLAGHAAEMQAAHCGQLPERSLASFALAQYVRDANMARVMTDSWLQSERKIGAILIAGAGHARKDRGVPLHLARRAPGAKIVSLAFVEAEDGASAEADWAKLPYDLVWFTARVEDGDGCNAMPDEEND